jgi:hypothetical protein
MKTTKQQFDRFCDVFNGYMVEFGLTQYRVSFEHVDIDGCYADITADSQNCVATVRLNKNVDEWVDLESVALHECLHLLLAELTGLARCRFVSEDGLERAEEGCIRRLQRVIGNRDKK